MSTIFTHPVVPLALGVGLGARSLPPRLIIVGCLLCILPDADVFAFRHELVWIWSPAMAVALL